MHDGGQLHLLRRRRARKVPKGNFRADCRRVPVPVAAGHCERRHGVHGAVRRRTLQRASAAQQRRHGVHDGRVASGQEGQERVL